MDYAGTRTASYLFSFSSPLLANGGVLRSLLVRGGLYYAARQGVPAAKWLLTLGFAVLLYCATYWQQGILAGVNFARFNASSFMMLANDLLTLAALVLMFSKPRESVPTQEKRERGVY